MPFIVLVECVRINLPMKLNIKKKINLFVTDMAKPLEAMDKVLLKEHPTDFLVEKRDVYKNDFVKFVFLLHLFHGVCVYE